MKTNDKKKYLKRWFGFLMKKSKTERKNILINPPENEYTSIIKSIPDYFEWDGTHINSEDLVEHQT